MGDGGSSGRTGPANAGASQAPINPAALTLTRTPTTAATALSSSVSRNAVRFRFPALETFAYQFGGILARDSRSLTDDERREARTIFENSLDLDSVRIVTSSLIVAPTTLGDYIRRSGPIPTEVLIHELTHVWQYQHGGSGYISDSVCHQIAALASTGSRNAAYDLTDVIRPEKRFSNYTAEQQAMIVQRYYSESDARADPIYQALIAEVRREAPIPPALRQRLIYEEAMFGPAGPARRDPLQDDRSSPQIMPLLRIEF